MHFALAVGNRTIKLLFDRHRMQIEQFVHQALHPKKRNSGRSVFRIAAADIRMNAAKPGLMDGLVWRGGRRVAP
jgi:hypothetical protein